MLTRREFALSLAAVPGFAAVKTPNPDVFSASAVELNGRLKAKEFTALELVRAFAEHLEADAGVAKQALKAAKDIDGDLKRERYRGPLQGIPFSWAETTPPKVLGRLAGAGALGIAKLPAMGAFAVGPLSGTESGVLAVRPTPPPGFAPGFLPIGPICRTIEDCGHVLAAISSFHYFPQYARPVKELTLGYTAESETVAAFRSQGGSAMKVTLPGLPYEETLRVITTAEAGAEMPVQIYLKALRTRSEIEEALRLKVFPQFDVLIAPVAAGILAGSPILIQPKGPALMAKPNCENLLLAVADHLNPRKPLR